jgi:HD-like signal output (HDOD) protein
MSQDPDTPARAYEAVIERDAALAGKVLRVASSSFYAVGEIQNISRAISVLGMNALKSLVLTISYQQMLSNERRSESFNGLDCWRHSLATAIAARILAKIKIPQRSEEMYTAGLLHDVGLLVFDKFCPSLLDQAITRASGAMQPLHMAEQDLFGFNHGAVGAMLAKKWGLSKSIQAAIEFQYDPFENEKELVTTSIITAANALAFECGCYNNAPVPDEGFNDTVIEVLGLPVEQYAPICEVVRAEVDKAQANFAPQQKKAA